MAAARAAGCYKVILDCSDDNVDFYAKAGFQRKEVHMVRPLKASALCQLVLQARKRNRRDSTGLQAQYFQK